MRDKSNITAEGIKSIGVFTCVIFTLICGGLSFFCYYGYSESKREFEQKNNRLLALEADLKGLKQLIRTYKEEREELEVLVFSDKDIATFLSRIADFAKGARVRVVDMKAQRLSAVKLPEEMSANIALARKDGLDKENKETGPSLAFMPIKMSIEGEFEPIVAFLFSLENYRQLLSLSDVGIKREKYPILNCDFTLRLYSLKQLEEILKQ